MATILNQPVYGYKQRETPITAGDLMGETEAGHGEQAPNALRDFIEAGARVQKAQREARNG